MCSKTNNTTKKKNKIIINCLGVLCDKTVGFTLARSLPVSTLHYNGCQSTRKKRNSLRMSRIVWILWHFTLFTQCLEKKSLPERLSTWKRTLADNLDRTASLGPEWRVVCVRRTMHGDSQRLHCHPFDSRVHAPYTAHTLYTDSMRNSHLMKIVAYCCHSLVITNINSTYIFTGAARSFTRFLLHTPDYTTSYWKRNTFIAQEIV